MTSVASETVFSSRNTQFQRSQPASQAPDNDKPFALMLEASAPLTESAPRRQPEPSTPVVPSQKKAAAAPNEPAKKKTANDTPDSKAAGSSETSENEAVAGDKMVQEAAADPEAPVVAEAPPDFPQTGDTAEDSPESADAEAVIVQAQTETVQPRPVVTPEAAIAAPTVATPGTVAPAHGEGEAVPAITVKPLAAGAPATKPADVPVNAPVTDAPELPLAAAAKEAQAIPDIKSKIEVKPTEQPVAIPEQTANAEIEPNVPQQTKTEPGRPLVPPEDAKLQQVESKPHAEVQQQAEPAQQKPALAHMTALDTDMANTPLPAAQQPVATDVASPAAGNPRMATLMAQSPVPVSGIAVEIAAQAKAGNNRFEIRLDPPELGRIDVRLDVDQDGNVKSRLVIERADTYDLLRKDASTLERALQQAGLKTSDNGLEFTLRDQGSAQREARDQNPRNTDRGIIADADILPAEAASGYGRVPGLGSGVDIRI